MKFFIQDLYRQIEEIYSHMNKTHSLIVYHGQGMSNVEFENLQKYKGELLSFDNFLLTNIDRQVSFDFAMQSLNYSNRIAVLFKINIDPSISSKSFALIDNIDHLSQTNKQILFSLHTIFRIIDYKTGAVQANKVELVNWEDLTTDYDKHSKSFQVLMYAYILNNEMPFDTPVEAGIISFKNLKAGFLKFGLKEGPRSSKKDQRITQDTLNAFEVELKKLILEICNPETEFIQKLL